MEIVAAETHAVHGWEEAAPLQKEKDPGKRAFAPHGGTWPVPSYPDARPFGRLRNPSLLTDREAGDEGGVSSVVCPATGSRFSCLQAARAAPDLGQASLALNSRFRAWLAPYSRKPSLLSDGT